jgi:hypothetical protein
MILGAALTVGAAYFHDLQAGGLATGQATEKRTMVNWDVVESNWRAIVSRAREGWHWLSAG